MWRIVCLHLPVVFCLCACSRLSTVEKHHFGSKYVLTLTTESRSETGESLLYGISSNNEVLVRKTYIGGNDDLRDRSGRYLASGPNDGVIFSFVAVKDPSIVVVMYDSASGLSWPRGRDSDFPAQIQQMGETMLRRIQINSNRALRLWSR